MKYFERGIERQSLTTRLPSTVVDDLTDIKDAINQHSGTRVSRNDLLTIGGILISELKIADHELDDVHGLSDLYTLLKSKLTSELTK